MTLKHHQRATFAYHLIANPAIAGVSLSRSCSTSRRSRPGCRPRGGFYEQLYLIIDHAMEDVPQQFYRLAILRGLAAYGVQAILIALFEQQMATPSFCYGDASERGKLQSPHPVIGATSSRSFGAGVKGPHEFGQLQRSSRGSGTWPHSLYAISGARIHGASCCQEAERNYNAYHEQFFVDQLLDQLGGFIDASEPCKVHVCRDGVRDYDT